MPSKIVVNKQRSAAKVVAAGRANAAAIAKEFVAKNSEFYPKGAFEPSLLEATTEAGINASCDRLESSSVVMGAADEAYLVEQSDDAEPRKLRDEAIQALYTALVDLREAVQGAFGVKEVSGFGFSSATPRDPAQISRFAGEVLATFEKRKSKMPSTKPGLSFDPKSLLEKVSTHKTSLDESTRLVMTEERELQIALAEKNRTIEAYDAVFSQTANFLEGMFLFVGMTELASKVRPSSRRPGETAEDEEQEQGTNQ